MFLLLAFILPITGIILTNLYFLGIAGWRLHKHYSSSPLINRTRTSSLKSYISGLCGLVSMMGVTWSLGLISVMYPSQILTYSFTVVNASQGVLIFVFNCILNKKIRVEGLRRARGLVVCLRYSLRSPLVRKESTTSTTSNTNTTQV